MEIKNREWKEKIFYTFYILGIGVIILPFLKIIDLFIVYVIFTILYSMLLYGIYTEFELFTRLNELFLTAQQVDKKKLIKVDYEFLDLINNYFNKILKSYKINTYQITDIVIDEILIWLSITLTWVFLLYLLANHVI